MGSEADGGAGDPGRDEPAIVVLTRTTDGRIDFACEVTTGLAWPAEPSNSRLSDLLPDSGQLVVDLAETLADGKTRRGRGEGTGAGAHDVPAIVDYVHRMQGAGHVLTMCWPALGEEATGSRGEDDDLAPVMASIDGAADLEGIVEACLDGCMSLSGATYGAAVGATSGPLDGIAVSRGMPGKGDVAPLESDAAVMAALMGKGPAATGGGEGWRVAAWPLATPGGTPLGGIFVVAEDEGEWDGALLTRCGRTCSAAAEATHERPRKNGRQDTPRPGIATGVADAMTAVLVATGLARRRLSNGRTEEAIGLLESAWLAADRATALLNDGVDPGATPTAWVVAAVGAAAEAASVAVTTSCATGTPPTRDSEAALVRALVTVVAVAAGPTGSGRAVRFDADEFLAEADGGLAYGVGTGRYARFTTWTPSAAGRGEGDADWTGSATRDVGPYLDEVGGGCAVDVDEAGSRAFVIVIPASSSSTEEQAGRPTDDATPLLEGEVAGTVMIVEPDETVRELAATALCEAGFEVLVTDGGVGARTLLASHVPDLALLADELPDIGAGELADEIGRCGTKCLRMTTGGEGTGLRKPFGARGLVDRCREAMGAPAD